MRTYDPTAIIVSFGGVQILGFASGEFAKAELNNDRYTVVVGAGGDVTRVRSRDTTGQFIVTLLSESPSNDYLGSKQREDELFNSGTGSLQITNLNGDELAFAEVAWVKKPAAHVYADTASPKEYVFECEELIQDPRGALT